MKEMLSFFKTVYQTYWGNGPFQWIFYISIILIICVEKRKSIRIIFGWYAVVFHLMLFNPITFKKLLSIFTWDHIPYYCRMFAMIPVFYCMIYGIMIIVQKVKGFPKLIITVCICILIGYFGTNVYKLDWMKKADNLGKIPRDLDSIVEALNDESDICVAVPESLSSYIRQEAAEFYTPYGRSVNSLGVALGSNEPDVTNIMTMAGSQSCDYIVVNNLDSVKNAFENEGYTPYYQSNDYLIYEVSGVPKNCRTFNDLRQISSSCSFDKDGNIKTNEYGYSITKYEYDKRGYRSKETYYDKNDDIYTVEYGFSSVGWTWSYSGLITSTTYYNEDGKPTESSSGYSIKKSEYNKDRQLIRETFCGVDGNPIIRKDTGYAQRTLSYNINSIVEEERFYDTEGELILNNSGYAGINNTIDDSGKVIKVTYLGVDQNPIMLSEGYAGYTQEYLDDGSVIQREYFDDNDNSATLPLGYHTMRETYDSSGVLQLSEYYDESGDLIQYGSGYFHYYLNELINQKDNMAIFISAKDEASEAITSVLTEDLQNLGISNDLRGKYRQSFCAVITPEKTEDILDVEKTSIDGSINGIDYSVISAGFNSGNISSIIIGGKEYSNDVRGLNIVVYDLEKQKVIDAVSFDTNSPEMRVYR